VKLTVPLRQRGRHRLRKHNDVVLEQPADGCNDDEKREPAPGMEEHDEDDSRYEKWNPGGHPNEIGAQAGLTGQTPPVAGRG
jgi:hypothetical protein